MRRHERVLKRFFLRKVSRSRVPTELEYYKINDFEIFAEKAAIELDSLDESKRMGYIYI